MDSGRLPPDICETRRGCGNDSKDQINISRTNAKLNHLGYPSRFVPDSAYLSPRWSFHTSPTFLTFSSLMSVLKLFFYFLTLFFTLVSALPTPNRQLRSRVCPPSSSISRSATAVETQTSHAHAAEATTAVGHPAAPVPPAAPADPNSLSSLFPVAHPIQSWSTSPAASVGGRNVKGYICRQKWQNGNCQGRQNWAKWY